MTEERLSYRDFVIEFLIACAIAVDARTDILIDSELAVRFVPGRHSEGWPLSAMRQLADDGLLRGSYTMDQPPRFNLTGPGLARAEQVLEERGDTLLAAIDRNDQKLIELQNHDYAFVPPADTLVLDAREDGEETPAMLRAVIRLSDGARSLNRHIEETLGRIRSAGALPRVDGSARTQDEIDQEHLMLLVPCLQWFIPRVRHDRLRAQLQKSLTAAEKAIAP